MDLEGFRAGGYGGSYNNGTDSDDDSDDYSHCDYGGSETTYYSYISLRQPRKKTLVTAEHRELPTQIGGGGAAKKRVELLLESDDRRLVERFFTPERLWLWSMVRFLIGLRPLVFSCAPCFLFWTIVHLFVAGPMGARALATAAYDTPRGVLGGASLSGDFCGGLGAGGLLACYLPFRLAGIVMAVDSSSWMGNDMSKGDGVCKGIRIRCSNHFRK